MGWSLNTAFFDIAASEKSVLAASDFYIPFEIGPSQADKKTQIQPAYSDCVDAASRQ